MAASKNASKRSTSRNTSSAKAEKKENTDIKRQIKGEIYDALRTALVKPQRNKKSWAEMFIQEMLDSAKSEPTGALGQLIAKQILQEDIISSLDEQTERLLSRDMDFMSYRIYKQCYKEQRDVLLDDISRNILVNTGRRTGKTNLAARWLVKKCVQPNTPCFYYHLKFDNAIRQCFDLCIECANKAELSIESSSKNEGVIVFSNGSSITFRGNSNKSEADKSRGYRARGIVIDEAAYQINMSYLVNDILTPMMADFKDSQIMLISTPPRIPKTFYEECYRSGTWTVYEWYANKNPFIPSFDNYIEELCKKKGLKKDSPFIQREGYGKFVYDTEAMIFKDYQTYKDIPADFVPTDVAIGCDYGFQDYNAIIALAYNRHTRYGYAITEAKFNRSTVSEIVEQCRKIYEDAKRFCIERDRDFDLSHIRFYCDTNEQSISYEMSTNYGLPISNCYKHDKKMAISQLSDWCRTGKIKNKEKGVLADEFERTVYKRDEQDNILTEIDDDAFHPDAVDALLYASRQYAWDCGIDGSDDNEEDIAEENGRDNTLPEWLQSM